MIFVNLNIDVLRQQLESNREQTINYLQQAPKSFTVSVQDITYTVEYEVRGTRVEFFAEAPESLPNLAKATTRFNIGSFLLPDAMCTSKIVHPSDFVPMPETIEHDTNPEISPEIGKKILSQIEKQGFLNLISTD